MTDLVLNRRQNHANIRLTDDGSKESVGYLRSNGEWRFVPWLGFIERSAARELTDGRPVRLVNISRIGRGDQASSVWEDVPEGMYVHGCLTARGAYALYDASVVLVGPPTKA